MFLIEWHLRYMMNFINTMKLNLCMIMITRLCKKIACCCYNEKPNICIDLYIFWVGWTGNRIWCRAKGHQVMKITRESPNMLGWTRSMSTDTREPCHSMKKIYEGMSGTNTACVGQHGQVVSLSSFTYGCVQPLTQLVLMSMSESCWHPWLPFF